MGGAFEIGSDYMKIEKINDNQIRCTLGKKDLADRNLKVSELAYGSDKARELFKDMIQQASFEVGFEAEDIPLMIEAIPVNADCIVLIVTKVDEPEELDTRFSRFSSEYSDDSDYPDEDFRDFSDMEEIDSDTSAPSATDELKPEERRQLSGNDANVGFPSDDVANDVMNLFNKVKDFINSTTPDTSGSPSFSQTASQSGSQPDLSTRVFSFKSFDEFSEAAAATSLIFKDKSTLYLDASSGRFYLTLERATTSNIDYNKTCNILSEYGTKESLNSSSVCYFREHYRCIIQGRAIQVASKL